MNERFEKYIKQFGFKIRKVAFRPDILSVQFMNKHLMTIPKKMYGHPNPRYTDMSGNTHPDYFECEKQAQQWNIRVKRSNFLEEDWELERQFNQLYK